MVRNNRSQLRDSRVFIEETALSAQIGEALRGELGASRRATKTVMRWTGVSDTTARAWLYGRSAPSGPHLLALAANSRPVMAVLLRLTGHGELELGLNLQEIERGLLLALSHVRAIVDSQV
jgi:hypothetical protein